MFRKKTSRKEPPPACSKPSTDGASATCVDWPLCRKFALSERLGREGLRLQQLARGTASRTLVPVEAPPIFEEAVELEHPIVLLEPLAFLLNRLLEQICARLGSRALATQELRLTLELENLTSAPISNQQSTINNLPAPSACLFPCSIPKFFSNLLQLDLNAHPPGAPILKIHLAAEPAHPRSAQGGLFLPPSPEPEKLELTLARIAGMVGENKVGALELLDTHHPEGFRMRRFVAEVARKTPQKKTPDSADSNRRRHRPAPLPPALASQRNFGKRPAGARGVRKEKRSARRRALEGRPLARLRRLVGARSLVARRMGRSPAQRRCRLFLPPRARSARRRLVRGRNL